MNGSGNSKQIRAACVDQPRTGATRIPFRNISTVHRSCRPNGTARGENGRPPVTVTTLSRPRIAQGDADHRGWTAAVAVAFPTVFGVLSVITTVRRFQRMPTRHSDARIARPNNEYSPQKIDSDMKKPVRVTITGAAGQIGYQLAFRIASGQMLGEDQSVILQLLEIPPALPALDGVAMELNDCTFSTLAGIVATDDANTAFRDADYALLVGARPRGSGMERKDLLEANAQIFSVQGEAINKYSNRDIRVLVVGNPANTNALIASSNAPDIDRSRFTAMTRLDHNRAIAQLAAKTGTYVGDIRCMTIWGNHSASQYPDIYHATVAGQQAVDLIDEDWLAG